MIASVDQIATDHYRGMLGLAPWHKLTFSDGIAKKGTWLQLFQT